MYLVGAEPVRYTAPFLVEQPVSYTLYLEGEGEVLNIVNIYSVYCNSALGFRAGRGVTYAYAVVNIIVFTVIVG